MKSTIKRWLFLGLSVSLAALTAWRLQRASEIEGRLEPPQPQVPDKPNTQPLQDAMDAKENAAAALPEPSAYSATTVTFSGTVVRNGARLALRETAGALYPLEGAPRAWSYEGADVRVTGKIDLSTRLLRVDAIEPAAL